MNYSNKLLPDWTPTREVYAYMLGRFGKGDIVSLASAALGPISPEMYRVMQETGWIDENGEVTEAFKAELRR